jgi:hypothetical protein
MVACILDNPSTLQFGLGGDLSECQLGTCSEDAAKGISDSPARGLSQAELDMLSSGAGGEDDQPPSPEAFEELLVRRRRMRRYRGSDAGASLIEDVTLQEVDFSDAINAVGDIDKTAPPGGLSQAELDALNISNSDSEDAEEVPVELSDEMLFSLRRRRCFMGDAAAHAFAADAMCKILKSTNEDFSENLATMICKRPCGSGLTQEELDALSISVSDDVEAPSPSEDMGSEALMLRIRRARHFLGDEAADALALDACRKVQQTVDQARDASEETVSTTSGSNSLSVTVSSPKGSGISQAELDALSVWDKEESPHSGLQAGKADSKFHDLCIETGSDAMPEELSSLLEQVPTPQRKRSHGIRLSSSPERV